MDPNNYEFYVFLAQVFDHILAFIPTIRNYSPELVPPYFIENLTATIESVAEHMEHYQMAPVQRFFTDLFECGF